MGQAHSGLTPAAKWARLLKLAENFIRGAMFTFLLVLLILDSLILLAAVLLQAGKGGGLAASFGGAASSTDSFVGMRQAANLLTRLSWWCGGTLLLLAYVLSIMSTRASTPRSVLDQPFSQPTSSRAPATKTAPAVPLEPATTPQGAPQGKSAAPGTTTPATKSPATKAPSTKAPSTAEPNKAPPPTGKAPQP